MLPVAGIILFILLYVISTFLYPGGSDYNKTENGFNWFHNYWCELLAYHSQNGTPNPARPVTIVAMSILVISLIIFWRQVPYLFKESKRSDWVIRSSGITSMLLLPIMLVGPHDLVINLAAMFGCIAVILVLLKLFQHKMKISFLLGLVCLLLCGLNNYVYYSSKWRYLLPVIQKISFLTFLGWFAGLTIKLYKKESILKKSFHETV